MTSFNFLVRLLFLLGFLILSLTPTISTGQLGHRNSAKMGPLEILRPRKQVDCWDCCYECDYCSGLLTTEDPCQYCPTSTPEYCPPCTSTTAEPCEPPTHEPCTECPIFTCPDMITTESPGCPTSTPEECPPCHYTTPEPCPIYTQEPCPTYTTPEPCHDCPTQAPCEDCPTPGPCPECPAGNPTFSKAIYQSSLASWPIAGTTVHLQINATTQDGVPIRYELITTFEFLQLTPSNDVVFTSNVSDGAFVGPNNVMVIEVVASVDGDSSRRNSASVVIVFPRSVNDDATQLV